MRVALAVLLAVLLAGCGGTTTKTVVVTTARTVTATVPGTGGFTTPSTREQTIFLLRDGKVAAVTRVVPETQAVGADALRELALGPTAEEGAAGLTSAVPTGAGFQLSIDRGTAVV